MPTAAPTPAEQADADAELPYQPIPHHKGAPRPVVPASAADVQLTPGEHREALRVAREVKYKRLREGLVGWQRSNPPAPRIYTAEQLFAEKLALAHERCAARGRELELDFGFENMLKILSLYFTNDKRFNALKPGRYNTDKGLMIVGGPGRGKTFVMQLFQQNPRKCYGSKTAEEICLEYNVGGLPALTKYIRGTGAALCIQDVGREDKLTSHYRDDLNVLEKVLVGRADTFEAGQLPGIDTHFTTNLPVRYDDEHPAPSPDAQSLESRYYTRATSRFRGMFNLITFPPDAPDRRK